MEENEKSGINDRIALIILSVSFFIIVIIVGYWLYCSNDPERLFSIILPVISSWVGTLLAFYFGKTNFEAATKSYNEIINKLTPDVLDDILVKQVMIDKYTMVSMDITNPLITAFDLNGLRAFLDSINKSRLPVLEDGKVKYIIHKSIISDELLKSARAATFEAFITANPIVTQFEIINEDKKVEDARKLMKDNNYKDLFVIDSKNELVGWLTNTHIIRYMNNQ